jgi:hypothetical protein
MGNKLLTVVASIVTVLLLALTIVAFVNGHDQPYPEANVITQEFMEEYAHWRMWKELGSITLVWTIIGAIYIVIGIAWGAFDIEDNTARFVVPGILMILVFLLGLYLQPYSLFDVHNMATAKPNAQVCVVWRTYYKVDKIDAIFLKKRGARRVIVHYYFVYSNGAEEEVTEYQFEHDPFDQRFYIIMCGDTVVGRFSTDIYKLQ